MRSIVICGSKRYRKEIADFCGELEGHGVSVFRPNINNPISEGEKFQTAHVTRMVFKGLTLEHFDMIRKADVCYIFNKNSYVGCSVLLEIGFATALGKPIYALEPNTGDPCSDCLIDAVFSNADALLGTLR